MAVVITVRSQLEWTLYRGPARENKGILANLLENEKRIRNAKNQRLGFSCRTILFTKSHELSPAVDRPSGHVVMLEDPIIFPALFLFRKFFIGGFKFTRIWPARPVSSRLERTTVLKSYIFGQTL